MPIFMRLWDNLMEKIMKMMHVLGDLIYMGIFCVLCIGRKVQNKKGGGKQNLTCGIL